MKAEQPLQIETIIRKNGHIILKPKNKIIQMSHCAELAEHFAALEGSSNQLILDLIHVAYIDSTALGVIFRANNKLQDLNQRLSLVHIQAPLKLLLKITKSNRLLDIHSSIKELWKLEKQSVC